MTHASREALVAFADGELDEGDERHTARHLEACAECAAELGEVVEGATMFAWALHRLDEAEPPEWDTVVPAIERLYAPLANAGDDDVHAPADADAAPSADEAAPAPAPDARVLPLRARPAPAPRPRRTAWRWAAGLVLLAGAAAAAIVTPVLIERVFTDVPAPAGPAEEAVPAAASSGAVAVLPVAGAVTIALDGVVDGTLVRVVFEPRYDVIVDYRADVAPRFVARDGGITVHLAGAGTTLEVSVPEGVRSARVLVDGVEAALLSRGEIVRARPDLNVTIEVVNPGR